MASIDALVYNMASRDNEQSTIFVRKDWLQIMDNQSGLYNSNQCIIDTSSLSNSNKYTGYKEAYLNIPILITATLPSATGSGDVFAPRTDYVDHSYSEVFLNNKWIRVDIVTL